MKELIEKFIARILFAAFIIVMLDMIFVFTIIIIDSINNTELFNKYNEIATNLLVFGAIVAAISSSSIIFINIKDIWNSLK
ncbi:hypothetical protein KBA27_06800 [bacterium]|nr:hypothetical protein [bacterium]